MSSATTPAAVDVRHEPDRQRFVAVLDGLEGEASYRMDGPVVVMHHTEVDPRLQGRGVAAAMVAFALDHARAQGLKVRPTCSYVAAYFRRHAEQRDLLA